MIKLYICCLVLIIGSVEVGPDIGMKFHQEVMEVVSYDTNMILLPHFRVINTILSSYFESDSEHKFVTGKSTGYEE